MNDPLGALQDLEQKRASIVASGNVAQVEGILADDLIYCHANGTVDSKGSFLELLRSGMLKYLSVNPHIQHAVAIGTDTLLGAGQLATHVEIGGTLKMLNSSYLVMWTRINNDWRLVALKA